MRIDRNFRGLATTHEFDASSKQRRVLIGRPRDTIAPDLDLSPDFTVSRPHAALELLPDGEYWIEDLNSTHGTLVNGREIKGRGRHRLRAGDVIRLGDTTLRIDAPPERDSPQYSPFGTQGMNGQNGAHTPFDLMIGGKMDARQGVPELLRADEVKPATQNGTRRRERDVSTEQRLALACELPLQFAAQTRLPDLLQLIVQRLVETIPGATRGALVLCESEVTGENESCELLGHGEAGGVLVPQAFYPTDGPPVVSRMLARRAMSERAGFIWKRGDEDETLITGSIARYGIESGMYAPLLWQDSALGAVCVDNGGRVALAPFTPDDLRLMLMVAQYAAMAVANQRLQEDLRGAWTGALEALTSALASRDYETQSHCYRTVELTVALAKKMGVSESELPAMARGALLHDIGKIGITDNILFKPGALTPEERETMKGHARLGHEMLRHIPFFQDALPIVLHHHEQFDGNGYPLGLRGRQIPRGARIFHVVDLYDALTQERPYKSAWSHEAAIAEAKRLAGTQCDPEVVAALESLDREATERLKNLHGFSPSVRELLGRQSG